MLKNKKWIYKNKIYLITIILFLISFLTFNNSLNTYNNSIYYEKINDEISSIKKIDNKENKLFPISGNVYFSNPDNNSVLINWSVNDGENIPSEYRYTSYFLMADEGENGNIYTYSPFENDVISQPSLQGFIRFYGLPSNEQFSNVKFGWITDEGEKFYINDEENDGKFATSDNKDAFSENEYINENQLISSSNDVYINSYENNDYFVFNLNFTYSDSNNQYQLFSSVEENSDGEVFHYRDNGVFFNIIADNVKTNEQVFLIPFDEWNSLKLFSDYDNNNTIDIDDVNDNFNNYQEIISNDFYLDENENDVLYSVNSNDMESIRGSEKTIILNNNDEVKLSFKINKEFINYDKRKIDDFSNFRIIFFSGSMRIVDEDYSYYEYFKINDYYDSNGDHIHESWEKFPEKNKKIVKIISIVLIIVVTISIIIFLFIMFF